MIDYEEFKSRFKTELWKAGSIIDESFTFEEKEISKVNKVKDGLLLKTDTLNEKKILPVAYLDDLYIRYRTGESLSDLAESVLGGIKPASLPRGLQYITAEDFTKEGYYKVREKIFFTLVNTELNEGLLDEVPHREFMDLSVVYRIKINETPDSVISTSVNNYTAESLGMSEEALYKTAYENTKKLFPIKVFSMAEAFAFMADDPIANRMYTLSNESLFDGAVNILYQDELDKIAADMGEDIYIIPSSVHECIAVPASDVNVEELSGMIREVNNNHLKPDERLSYNLYKYNAREKKLTQETDKKALDLLQPEKQEVRRQYLR